MIYFISKEGPVVKSVFPSFKKSRFASLRLWKRETLDPLSVVGIIILWIKWFHGILFLVSVLYEFESQHIFLHENKEINYLSMSQKLPYRAMLLERRQNYFIAN